MNGEADRRERILAALARYEANGKAKRGKRRGRKAESGKMNYIEGMGAVLAFGGLWLRQPHSSACTESEGNFP